MLSKIRIVLWIGIAFGLWACTATPTAPVADATPLAPRDRDRLSVEGSVEPARWITLRTAEGGAVRAVMAQEGAATQAGQVLVQLDRTDADLAVQEADAALAAAQAHLAQVRAGARPEQITVLAAQVAAADAVITQTEALLTQHLTLGAEVEQAEAQAQVAAADLAYQQANQSHDDTMRCYAIPGSDEKICPALGTFEEMARAQMQAAHAELLAAQARLKAIPGTSGAQADEVRATVGAARAERAAAQAQLDLLRAGAAPEAIAVAEAGVRQAEATLAAARVLLTEREVVAPFAGVITDLPVRVGDTLPPGAALFTLATLDHLRIRTHDLTEMDVVQVAMGQSVQVTFDARPDRVLEGQVVRIDPQASDYQGDVTYAVFIELTTTPEWLRWGMTAQIEIQVR